MKLLPFIILPLFTSCTHMTGNSQTGQYSLTSVATDLDGLAQSSDRIVIMKQNQSKVPLSAIRTLGTFGVASLQAGVSETLSNNSTKEVLGEQATTRSISEGKEITKRLGIVTEGQVKLIEAVPGKP